MHSSSLVFHLCFLKAPGWLVLETKCWIWETVHISTRRFLYSHFSFYLNKFHWRNHAISFLATATAYWLVLGHQNLQTKRHHHKVQRFHASINICLKIVVNEKNIYNMKRIILGKVFKNKVLKKLIYCLTGKKTKASCNWMGKGVCVSSQNNNNNKKNPNPNTVYTIFTNNPRILGAQIPNWVCLAVVELIHKNVWQYFLKALVYPLFICLSPNVDKLTLKLLTKILWKK